MNIEQLEYLKSLDIGKTVARTVTQIQLFLQDNDAYISLSGGEGSTVLADINKRYRLGLKCVTVANAEEPENLKICKEFNSIFVNGKMTRKEIFTKYGYPVISKQVAMAISRYARTKRQDQKDYRLNGRVVNGKKHTAGTIPNKYKFMIYAPYELSEACCDWTKKKPLKKWAKENNSLPITGEMAAESDQRRRVYLKTGCIQEGKKCTPMGFWTDEKLKEYIQLHNVKISELYKNENCTRTGCVECMFGILKDPNRFDRIKETKLRTYTHLMWGGKWIRKERFRFVKFRVGSIPIWSNLYFVPSKDGYGFEFVLKYLYEGLRCQKMNNVIVKNQSTEELVRVAITNQITKCEDEIQCGGSIVKMKQLLVKHEQLKNINVVVKK